MRNLFISSEKEESDIETHICHDYTQCDFEYLEGCTLSHQLFCTRLFIPLSADLAALVRLSEAEIFSFINGVDQCRFNVNSM